MVSMSEKRGGTRVKSRSNSDLEKPEGEGTKERESPRERAGGSHGTGALEGASPGRWNVVQRSR